MSLTGSALAMSSGDSCEEDLIYGTMTREVFGEVWQDNVIAIAVENSEIDLAQEGTETIIVRSVSGGSGGAVRRDNSAFTFAIESNPALTATGSEVDSSGVITAGTTPGTGMVSVSLTGYDNVAPAYVKFTVT